jgi:hypothetical protein
MDFRCSMSSTFLVVAGPFRGPTSWPMPSHPKRQRSEDFLGLSSLPRLYYHLVKCAVALVLHPVLNMTKVIFGYILRLLNKEGHKAFFDLQKSACKANNAEKEKRRLAQKRSRAAKRERKCEAEKAAQLPPPGTGIPGLWAQCGRKFASRKKARSTSALKPQWAHHSGRGQQIRCQILRVPDHLREELDPSRTMRPKLRYADKMGYMRALERCFAEHIQHAIRLSYLRFVSKLLNTGRSD